MKNEENHKIAGNKTRVDWKAIRIRLIANAPNAWPEAFTDFYMKRLNLRYISPIRLLQDNDSYQGEGFSIVAIQCSLIEFLESTEQGTNYRYIRRSEKLKEYEYNASREIFIEFLRKRAPFSTIFDDESAHDFYIGVRCGLLHEACTRKGWRILAKNPSGIAVDVVNRIVFRDCFQKALLAYIDDYGSRLQQEPLLQQAFIRKFDSL